MGERTTDRWVRVRASLAEVQGVSLLSGWRRAHGRRADDLQPRVAVGILARPARDRVRDLHAVNNSLMMRAMPARIAGTGGNCSI